MYERVKDDVNLLQERVDCAGISETVLTQQEAGQMLEKDIVIQDRLFVTYDSERRIWTRGNRELPTKDSMITEYRYTDPVSPELLIREAHPDERLRKGVGEEKLIMHSLLTGQNFIKRQ